MNAEAQSLDVVTHPVNLERRDDGSMIVTSTGTLKPYARCMTDQIEKWAEATPDKVLVAQRSEDKKSWDTITYAEAVVKIRAIAQFMLDKNLSADRPVEILSGNSIEHLLVGLAAMYVGVPFSPISTAYSLISSDYGKLKHITNVLTPGLIFADNLGPYRDAIDACAPADCHIVSVQADHGDDEFKFDLTLFDAVLNTEVTDAVAEANSKVNGDTIAKFLFTSGSTGMPKGVINTQQMICGNQEIIGDYFQFCYKEGPVLCDWLPWNHTFGGNQNIGMVLYFGGTMYIDGGKPVPAAIAETVNNLRDVAPSIYFNVPKGYELLVKELKANPDVAATFFSKLKVLYYAGAGMAQHIWDDLAELSIKYTGSKIPMLTGMGSTETAPAALFAPVKEAASGVVGVPAPGVEIKLVPSDTKLEARIKGVSITPGYWRDDEKTKGAYDEEGYYCLGDALKFIDENEPSRGFYFDGRVSDDFKLDTGTWVAVGNLKVAMIHHFAPYIQDVVIVGRDRGFITALVFPDYQHCKELIGEEAKSFSNDEVVNHEKVRAIFKERLQSMAEKSTGSSTRIKALTLQSVPGNIDAHEITDKGSLNSNAVVSNRADMVEDMYSKTPSDNVIGL